MQGLGGSEGWREDGADVPCERGRECLTCEYWYEVWEEEDEREVVSEMGLREWERKREGERERAWEGVVRGAEERWEDRGWDVVSEGCGGMEEEDFVML